MYSLLCRDCITDRVVDNIVDPINLAASRDKNTHVGCLHPLFCTAAHPTFATPLAAGRALTPLVGPLITSCRAWSSWRRRTRWVLGSRGRNTCGWVLLQAAGATDMWLLAHYNSAVPAHPMLTSTHSPALAGAHHQHL